METRVFQGMEGEVKLYLYLLLVEWRIFSSFSIPFGMKFGKFFIGAKVCLDEGYHATPITVGDGFTWKTSLLVPAGGCHRLLIAPF